MTSPAGSEQDRVQLKRILNLQVPVIAVIGEKRMKLGEVVKLTAGSIIELNKPGDAPLDLMVNDRRVGRGKPVRSGDRYGLEIAEIGNVQETIKKLGVSQPKS